MGHARLDNIVWGTSRGDDNIVWGTGGDDNIVWGTRATTTSSGALGRVKNVVWPYYVGKGR